MEIKRDVYLQKLVRKQGNGLVKIITGIRRSGKSYLLFTLFHNYLINNGISSNHIIEVALDDRTNLTLRNPDNMLQFIKERIKDEQRYYIILDEVQLLAEFEDVLNSLLHINNADVYVTGSNSKFLSSDIITEFRGRGDEIRVYPLSFAEFVSAYSGSKDEAWDDYCNYGGLPLILKEETIEDKTNYLLSQLKKVYISDIMERNRIQNPIEFDELLDILASSIGSFTSPKKLSNTFQSVKNKKISDKTIRQYLEYMQNAFLISKARRFDVKGKKYINVPVKYYFEDVGLRNALLAFSQTEENHIMENIIYNELRIRGYQVAVGIVDVYGKDENGITTKQQLEVDFVATQGSKKYYIQSAYALPSSSKIIQEQRPFLKINDSFKKIIIVRDNIQVRRNEQGIATIGVINFLLNENSLDL
ncbi:MAG: ATP-binding protein [Bacilli bacterium]|nr:ATP-binding protein [Bacilli bacterium]